MLDRDRLRAALAGLKGRPIEPIVPLPRLCDQPFAPAAVLIPIVERPRPGLILTRRRDGLRRHAGEISFPGGRLDPEDAGPVAGALREAREEIALDPAQVDVIGLLDPVVVGTGFIVTPVVGVVPPDLPLAPQEEEVAGILEVPLAHATDPANQRLETAEFAGRVRSFYVIDWADARIWGATARMLVELGKRLA
jgi:8-oxo-dGTP pyrophosphatase MutT (NUDIX family)